MNLDKLRGYAVALLVGVLIGQATPSDWSGFDGWNWRNIADVVTEKPVIRFVTIIENSKEREQFPLIGQLMNADWAGHMRAKGVTVKYVSPEDAGGAQGAIGSLSLPVVLVQGEQVDGKAEVLATWTLSSKTIEELEAKLAEVGRYAS